ERRRDERQTFQRAGHDDQRVALAGLLLRLRDPIAITLAVAELQRIERLEIRGELVARARIEKHLEPLARADSQMVVALRADVQIALQLRAIQLRRAARALHPQAFGYRALALLGTDAGRHQLVEPAHGGCGAAQGSGMIAESGCATTGRPSRPSVRQRET